MFEVIRLLFALCVLQKGPQDLPYSPFLLKLLLAGNFLVGVLIARLDSNWLSAALQSLTSLLVACIFCWLCLYFGRKRARLNQTLGAILGVDAMIGFFSLPAIATLSINQGGLTVVLLLIGLIGWHWTAIGHIIRHALDQSLSFGFAIALLYLIASYQIMALLFPEIPKTT